MSKKSMTLYVEADQEDGKIVWAIGKNPDPEKGKTPKIEFPEGSSYDVSIQLKDKTRPKRGIGFNKASPIYVQDGGSCPPKPCVGSSEIPENSIKVPNPTLLEFTNLNKNAGTLIYQLNFVDSKQRDVDPPLDPEFKNNGGGGRGLNTAAKIMVIAGCAALVAVLAVTSMREIGQ